MAEEFKPGQIVPESGVYRITHDPVHAEIPHEVTVIKGRRFPTCRHCKGVTFELVHAAKHVSEVPHLHQEASPQDALGYGVHSLIPEPLRDGHHPGIE
jgi:hypothetical protein